MEKPGSWFLVAKYLWKCEILSKDARQATKSY